MDEVQKEEGKDEDEEDEEDDYVMKRQWRARRRTDLISSNLISSDLT